jgi:hypothetical protein
MAGVAQVAPLLYLPANNSPKLNFKEEQNEEHWPQKRTKTLSSR